MFYLEFQSALFRTPSDVAAAIAVEWMSAGGCNDSDDIREAFSENTDEQLADRAISEWKLHEIANGDAVRRGDAKPQTWLDSRGLDRGAIVKAFTQLRTEQLLKMTGERTVLFIHDNDDETDTRIVSAFYGDTITKTDPVEYEILWNINVLDVGQPNERPAYDEEPRDGIKCFETEKELVYWMRKFSLVMA